MKKKNQELEKFKFVLDYKIKEQKRLVEPREKEIKELKDEKTKMEAELERFNKQNTQLELTMKETQSRLESSQKELREERNRVRRSQPHSAWSNLFKHVCPHLVKKREAELTLKRIKTDIHNCVGSIQDPKALKENIKSLFQKYVHDDVVSGQQSLSLSLVREVTLSFCSSTC